MKVILSLIISVALAVSGYAQTRNVLVGTNNAVVQPTNFWSADASNARAGLGLGTAATNPASAFQPSSAILSNLVSGGSLNFSNITIGISNVTGLQTALDGKLGTNPTLAIANISNLQTALDGKLGTNPTLQISNIAALQTALDGKLSGSFPIAISNVSGLQTSLDGKLAVSGTASLASNVTGIVALANGGTGGSNAATARTGIGATTIGSSIFTLANPSAIRFLRVNSDNTVSALSDSDFRTAIGLGTSATNPATAFQPSSTVLSNLASSNGSSLTNIPVAGVVGALATNGSAAGLTNFPTVALASNVTGTIAISNGGSGATTAGGARTNLGLGATNDVVFNGLTVGTQAGTFLAVGNTNARLYRDPGSGTLLLSASGTTNTFQFRTDGTLQIGGSLSFGATTNAPAYAAATRTNLGLGWSALTNTTASGFQAALFGTGTNPVLVNTNGEVVSPTNFWDVAPIQTLVQNFTPVVNATNAATNARTLYVYSLAISTVGVTNVITLPTNTATKNGDEVTVIHMGPTSSITAVRQLGQTDNLITINKTDEAVKFIYENNAWTNFHNISLVEPIYFSGTNASVNAAVSRTNLGLPLAALTNTDVTNFRTAIGLGATNNVAFSNIASSGTLTSTGVVTALSDAVVGGTLTATGSVTALSNMAVTGTLTATSTVTAKTNLVVEGFLDFTTNHTNVAPATNNQIQKFLQIRIGTNAFFLPLYQ